MELEEYIILLLLPTCLVYDMAGSIDCTAPIQSSGTDLVDPLSHNPCGENKAYARSGN
jgi:hypothetical protein